MSNRIQEVTAQDCGMWIEGASVNNPVEFSIAIVDLAVKNGLEIQTEAWETDKPIFLSGEASFDMVEDLGYITDIALEFLNSNLPEGFYFDFADGLCLFEESEEDFE